MSDQIRTGVVGLGEVWQTVHMPILRELPDLFRVEAICDVSPTLVAAFGDALGLPEDRCFADFRDLVVQSDIDLVMVLNNSELHATTALAAIDAGKHVFIEKPMSMTLAEADAIIEAQRTSNVQVIVGYMRRFAPAFLEARQRVSSLGDLMYGRVRAIIGPNATFIDQSNAVVIRPSDYPEAALRERASMRRAQVQEAIGDVSEELRNTFLLLGGLSSHDLSAMRELIGMPRGVMSASHWNRGHAIHAVFDYGDFQVSFETLVDQQPRFDAHIELFGSAKSLRIQYDSPYLRQLPTELHVSEANGHELRRSVIRPTFTDPYTHELRHLHGVLMGTESAKTTPEDAREDQLLFQWIIEAIRRTQYSS